MEFNLIREFVCTIIHVMLQNSIVIDSTYICMWEACTRREAEDSCLALNYSLIHVTPNIKEMMGGSWQYPNDNITIEFWANNNPDSNRPFGQMQYDNFPSNYDPSDLCIKIVYEVRHTRFGWVSVDCENQTAKAGTCCNQGLLFEARYKALLVLKKTNWYTADHICKEEGGTLFNNHNRIMNLDLSFDGTPWIEQNVTDFWSALSLNENQDPEMCSLSRVIPPEPSRLQFFHQIEPDWLDLCEKANYMSVCMIPSSQLFYSHFKDFLMVNAEFFLNTSSIAKNTTECMEECNGFNQFGVTCIGFNFDKKSSTCRFSEDVMGLDIRPDPSLSVDLYLLLPITPQIYSEKITTDTFYYTTDFSSITTDKTKQPSQTAGMIFLIVAALLASIASVVVLFSFVGRILSILNKNMFQKEELQTCYSEYDVEIPFYDDDDVFYSTNIIHSLPPLGCEGMIY